MILCLSDIHNSNVLHKIRKLLDLHSEIDAVFFLGDLSHHTEFAEGFIKLFHDAAIPFYCVPGNNDPLPVRELMNKMKCNVEEQEKMFMTWRVVGLGGSPITPFNTVYEKTEDKIKKQMSRMNIDNNTIIPMVNQIRYSIGVNQSKVIEYCKNQNIFVVAYSPLDKGNLLQNKYVIKMANKYQVSPAQICLRYLIQKGVGVIPKSVHEKYIQENIQLDFHIDERDMIFLDFL